MWRTPAIAIWMGLKTTVLSEQSENIYNVLSMKLENTGSGFHKNTHTQMVGCGVGVRNGDKNERNTEGVRSEK